MSNAEMMMPAVEEHAIPVETPQAIPRNRFGTFEFRLHVEFKDPEFRKQWYPYWIPERWMRDATLSGYVFVNADEIVQEFETVSPQDNDVGSRVRRSSNINKVSDPEYLYLMKKPMHIHLQHEAEREAYHQRIDGAIREGELNRQPNDGRYNATTQGVPGGTSLPPIRVQTSLSR